MMNSIILNNFTSEFDSTNRRSGGIVYGTFRTAETRVRGNLTNLRALGAY